MKKGFAFTLDALYAVILISLFLASYSFKVPQAEDTAFLNKIGFDILSALEKSNYFNFFDKGDAEINTNLDNLLLKLPKNVNGKVTLQRYESVSGVMTLKATYTRQDSAPQDEKVAVSRAIPDTNANKYYLLKLELWYA